jgi:hypothetical protein
MSEDLLLWDWREVSNGGGFGDRDTQEHINEVGVGIDAMQSARDQQRLNAPKIFRPNLSTTEEPVLSTHQNRSERPFKMIGINWDIWV